MMNEMTLEDIEVAFNFNLQKSKRTILRELHVQTYAQHQLREQQEYASFKNIFKIAAKIDRDYDIPAIFAHFKFK